MLEAARASGRVTLVGFNYLKNPIIGLAREIVESGEIGELVAFRGIHAEDYMVDSDAPHSFRTDPDGGGVLMDLGSHIISLARHLVGPIEEVSAATSTLHKTRPVRRWPEDGDDRRPQPCHRPLRQRRAGHDHCELGDARPQDAARVRAGGVARLGRFQRRAVQRAASLSRPIREKGGRASKPSLAGPDTPPYGNFCPAPGHQLGFNDLKTIEVAHLVMAVAGKEKPSPDFEEAYEIQRTVTAALQSAKERSWVRVDSL